MHMHAVTDDLGHHIVVLEDSAGQARGAVPERRHAIEEVRRVPRAGVDAGERLLVRGAGMPERYVVPEATERANERQRAIDLRRNRDDADVRSGRRYLLEDCVAAERPVGCRAAGQAQTLQRLSAAIVGIDEVALEMRRQNAR